MPNKPRKDWLRHLDMVTMNAGPVHYVHHTLRHLARDGVDDCRSPSTTPAYLHPLGEKKKEEKQFDCESLHMVGFQA